MLQRLIRHGVPTGNINIVVNGWDRRLHHPLAEVALALGEPLHAVIPLDARRARLALVRQSPLVFDRRSHAGRALLTLAGEIGGGRLSLHDAVAKESGSAPRRRWWPWPFRNRPNIEYGEA
jgi:hypothetical protein